jgi:hypothetical protein
LVTSHGGKVRKFDQGAGLSMRWASMQTGKKAQDGVCAGLSIAFLGLNRLPDAKNLMDAKDTHLEKGVLVYAERIAQFGGNYSEGLSGVDVALSKVSMARNSTLIKCQTPAGIAKTSLKSPSGRSIIKVKDHACAAITNKSENNFIFFDPNFGFAQFNSSLKYALFVKEFFGLGLYGHTIFDLIYVN